MEKSQTTTSQPLVNQNHAPASEHTQPERTKCYQISKMFTNLYNFENKSLIHKVLVSAVTLGIMGGIGVVVLWAIYFVGVTFLMMLSFWLNDGRGFS